MSSKSFLCFYCRFSKIEIYRNFYIKKCFANNNDSRINGMLYSEVEAVE